MPTIEVHDLVKVFPGRKRSGLDDVRAVDGISLRVDEGQVFGFLGPNGAGKTTAVRIMTTLLAPTSGTVRVAGHDVTIEPAAVREAIGVTLQDAGLDMLSTAREFLRLAGALYAIRDPDRRADELLEIVGLSDAADRRVGTFSGGMKRRLDLAAGLVHRPQLLFLDEPTTGLDPASRMNVWNEVRRLNDRGTTIFLTTQYLEEADVLAERLAIIDAGHIVTEGSPEQLKGEIADDVVSVALARELHDSAQRLFGDVGGIDRVTQVDGHFDVYTRDGAALVPQLVRRFDGAGMTVDAISLRRPTLDDVFLRATGHRLEGTTAPAALSDGATTQDVA